MKTTIQRNVLLMLTFLLLVGTICLIPLLQPGETAPAATDASTLPSTAAPTTVPPQTTLPPETTVPPTTLPLSTVDPSVSITAKNAFVYNCTRDHLAYIKDAGNTVMYPASITKLFSAYVALLYAEPDRAVTVGAIIETVPADSSFANLTKGDRLTVKDLIKGMLLPSGGDAARTLAVEVGRILADDSSITEWSAMERFVEEMNRQAAELGMKNTHFVNPDGYHHEDHYTCLEDLLLIGKLSMENDLIRTVSGMKKATVYLGGSSEIKSGDVVPTSKYYMVVNGALTIGPDTQQQLAQCVGMTVNGSLTCPESIYTLLNGVNVNGSITCYPDGAIVLKRSAVIDKLFTLRAKNSLYWSARRMIMVDPELDADKLKAKGVSFSTKEAIISQSKVESLIDMIDASAEIVIVPDGTAVVLDDITLDEDALRRYGKQLYVIGDVTVPEDADALDEIKYLNIRGDVKVPKDYKERLLAVLTEISGEVKIAKPKGATLEDKPIVKITKWMLEQQPLGIDVCDCAVVKIADNIPKELIVERLHIEDCGVVKCCEELEDAVTMICTDVGHIGAEGNDELGVGDMIKDALGGIKGALETKVINAAEYIL